MRRAYARHYVSAALALALTLGAVVHLFLFYWTSRGTSMDFLFFWGVKGVRFADAQAIDPELLRWRFFAHAVPEYPPLVPVTIAWAVLCAGDLPWIEAPTASVIWFVATIPLVFEFLKRIIHQSAPAVTAFWTVGVGTALARSFSGGNAEAPLLYFETVAALALIARSNGFYQTPLLGAVAVAGAVLTKVEGTVAITSLLLGAAIVDWIQAHRFRLSTLGIGSVAVTALMLWFGFQAVSNLPVGYRAHGQFSAIHFDYLREIAMAMIRYADAGAFGVPWIFAVTVLVITLRRHTLTLLIPTILAAAGLFAFLVFDYLHDVTDPTERISWTWTRTSLPILSLLILSAGIATFGKTGNALLSGRVRGVRMSHRNGGHASSGGVRARHAVPLQAPPPSPQRGEGLRSIPMAAARAALLWIAGAAALLIGPVRYWMTLPVRDLGVPATPVARINQMFSDQLLLLDQAEELIPKGASFSVSAFDRDAEMSLFMFALSELLDRYPMPMSYYGTATPQLGGRARYLVSYRCETLEPNLKLLGRFPQGCVFERQR